MIIKKISDKTIKIKILEEIIMYEQAYLKSLIKNDTKRMRAIERLNSNTYYYKNNRDRVRDELTAIWGNDYNPNCRS